MASKVLCKYPWMNAVNFPHLATEWFAIMSPDALPYQLPITFLNIKVDFFKQVRCIHGESSFAVIDISKCIILLNCYDKTTFKLLVHSVKHNRGNEWEWTLQSPVDTLCTASLTLTILRSAHTVYLCVSYVSQNKQRLFPYTALSDWFLQPRRSVYYVVRTGFLTIIQVNLSL